MSSRIKLLFKNASEGCIVNPIVQIVCISVNVLFMLIGLWYYFSTFTAFEPSPRLFHFTPVAIKKFGGQPSYIDVGLQISQFEQFDIIGNKFLFKGTLWFMVDPGLVSLATLGKFEFERGEIVKMSPPETHIVQNRLMVRYPIQVKFSSPINYKRFPLDSHRIYLVFIHPKLSPEEAIFEAREQAVKLESMVTPGWKIIDVDVDSGYIENILNEQDPSSNDYYPSVIFSFDVKRSSMKSMLAIFLPLLFIFYVMLFSLSMTSRRIQLTSVGVTATITYRFVIDNLSPPSGYFMISDYLFFLFLIIIFCIFLLSVFDELKGNLSCWVKYLAVFVTHLVVISVNMYFFFGGA